MTATKQHIGLLVFDDNSDKTPLANSRSEALEWWGALTVRSKKQVLSEYGFDDVQGTLGGWNELLTMYRSVHHSH